MAIIQTSSGPIETVKPCFTRDCPGTVDLLLTVSLWCDACREKARREEEASRPKLPRGWTWVDYEAVTCPHGHDIEWDGECPEGCVSPLYSMI